MSLSRRTLLIGGGASVAVAGIGLAGLVDANVLPGKQRLLAAVGGCGEAGVVPTTASGPVATGTFRSAARGGVDTAWTVLYPPGDDHAALPVCIAMHGRGGSHTWVLEGVHLDRYLADGVTNHGVPPFAIASVDGGESTNWHRRASGEDPLRMVTDELVPILGQRGLQVAPVGLWGWSLGGFGALRLGAQAGQSKIAAVVASSPALWTSFGAASDGVFDSAQDFAANDVLQMAGALAGIPVRIDCGAADPFSDAVATFRSSLRPAPDGGIEPGCHASEYWTRVAPAELQFMGTHLAGV